MNHNPVGWFEIYTEDLARAKAFYEAVLGIQLAPLEIEAEALTMLGFPMNPEAGGASGALVKVENFKPDGNGTLVYFSCQDCGVEASRVESAGGKVEAEKMSIGQYGFVALAFDTEGNMFGLHSLS